MKERKETFFNIPEYNLEEGIKKAREKIINLLNNKNIVVVGVAGGSASGKTSEVAKKLEEFFKDKNSLVISTDDYNRGLDYIQKEKKEGKEVNFDHPDFVDFKLLNSHIKSLKKGDEIEKPVYDFKKGERSGFVKISGGKVIIIEGLHVLGSNLKDILDFKIFVDVGFHGRILRRLIRDVERVNQRPDEILEFCLDVVEPMHRKYVEPTKNNADIIIKNEYNPEIESKRTGFEEQQVKFRLNSGIEDNEIYQKLKGVERLGEVIQEDIYYNPSDRNLLETGEVLRVRREGESFILTYKGPKEEKGGAIQRHKLELFITRDVAEKFINLYGKEVKTIKKRRIFYKYKNIVFSLDKVFKKNRNKEDKVGDFIEFRLGGGVDVNNEDIKEISKILGIDLANKIEKSYFEL